LLCQAAGTCVGWKVTIRSGVGSVTPDVRLTARVGRDTGDRARVLGSTGNRMRCCSCIVLGRVMAVATCAIR